MVARRARVVRGHYVREQSSRSLLRRRPRDRGGQRVRARLESPPRSDCSNGRNAADGPSDCGPFIRAELHRRRRGCARISRMERRRASHYRAAAVRRRAPRSRTAAPPGARGIVCALHGILCRPALGGTPAQHRTGRLHHAADRDHDGSLLRRDHLRERQSGRGIGPQVERSRGGVLRRWDGLQRVDGDGAGRGGALRSSVRVRFEAEGNPRAMAPVCRSCRHVGIASGTARYPTFHALRWVFDKCRRLD